ncbi:MAG: hypothetical protein D6B25_03650 [Desulfobulbaceae bacterium]|nr:MAG: hypothetical protein D6B25_03650 [Desulfobulbaceae bacterium]
MIEYFRKIARDPARIDGAVEVVNFIYTSKFEAKHYDCRDLIMRLQDVKHLKNMLATIFVARDELA